MCACVRACVSAQGLLARSRQDTDTNRVTLALFPLRAPSSPLCWPHGISQVRRSSPGRTMFQYHPGSPESPLLPHQPSAPFLQAGGGPASALASETSHFAEGLLAAHHWVAAEVCYAPVPPPACCWVCVPHPTPQCLCCQPPARHLYPSEHLLGSPVASLSSALEASCCVWEIAEGGWVRRRSAHGETSSALDGPPTLVLQGGRWENGVSRVC